MFLLLPLLLLACSFDYGIMDEEEEDSISDLVLQNFEYVRVIDKNIQIKMQGDRAEKWERAQKMAVERLKFAQYKSDGKTIGASGRAGSAIILFDSGDIELSDGVQLYAQEDDLIIESGQLSWYDDERILLSPDNSWVLMKEQNGTMISGLGFGADARGHRWEFANTVSGRYVYEKKQDEEAGEGEEAEEIGNSLEAGEGEEVEVADTTEIVGEWE